jgi:hypothetical protein
VPSTFCRLGQAVERDRNRAFDGGVAPVGGERLQGDGGRGGIALFAARGPAAVFALAVENIGDVEFARGLSGGGGIHRHRVLSRVQRQQRVADAAEAGRNGFVVIAQRQKQIAAADVARVAADGREGKRGAFAGGVIRRTGSVSDADDPGDDGAVAAFKPAVRHGAAAPGQRQRRPVAVRAGVSGFGHGADQICRRVRHGAVRRHGGGRRGDGAEPGKQSQNQKNGYKAFHLQPPKKAGYSSDVASIA